MPANIRPFLPADEIRGKVADMAREIEAAYPEERPLLVAVLKGSVFFLADLARELGAGYPMDFMAVSSYKAQQSTGNVQIKLDLAADIQDRHVLIVEDIVDTGLTLASLIRHLETRRPKSIKVAALLFKKDAYRGDTTINFVGFEIPKLFVVGYGMDLDGEYRNLPYVGIFEG